MLKYCKYGLIILITLFWTLFAYFQATYIPPAPEAVLSLPAWRYRCIGEALIQIGSSAFLAFFLLGEKRTKVERVLLIPSLIGLTVLIDLTNYLAAPVLYQKYEHVFAIYSKCANEWNQSNCQDAVQCLKCKVSSQNDRKIIIEAAIKDNAKDVIRHFLLGQ